MGIKPKVLIADDEPLSLELVVERLEAEGYALEVVSGGKAAVEAASRSSFKVVLTDLWMPDMTGMEVLAHFVANYPETPVIVLTGFGTIGTAVEAMKRGAYDYLSKPANLDEIVLTLQRAIEHKDLKEENVALRSRIHEQLRPDRIIGQSSPMQNLYRMIKRVADTDSTVLITGESGTGKELIANAIHYQSRRSDMPFVPINCGAIPEELLESELFGHEKGAFTGASKKGAAGSNWPTRAQSFSMKSGR
jgi:DNA-binding NtrC family response regulator